MKTETTLALVPPSDPILRTRAFEALTSEVLPHLDAMRKLMLERRGVGLAAPQVGIGLRFFITSFPKLPVAINPEWKPEADSGRLSKLEGCLTWPGRETYTARYERIVAQWTDANGKLHLEVLAGLAARVFQHETDHLNGVCVFT